MGGGEFGADGTRRITECRLCGSRSLSEQVDFGRVPLGNNLQETEAAARAADAYPLNVMRCGECGHFQLGWAVDPRLLYATNYTYLSGIGASFVRHFESYADWAIDKAGLQQGSLVVDVGSNDGTCLKPFKARGMTVCGVDPASMPAGIANENGIETLNDFFGPGAVEWIVERHGRADYVTSHNVLAHVDDLKGTFAAIHSLLKDGGHFGFEIGYFREVLRTGCFDTTYHEHLDYHTAAPLVRHLTSLGFDVLDLSINAVQGGSLRLLMKKTGEGRISEQAQAFLDNEAGSILHGDAFLKAWKPGIDEAMKRFGDAVRERAAKGGRVVGYGAPTKATLLMKLAGLGADEIACIVEDNALKQGRFMPGSGVPIVPTATLETDRPDALVIFAWNFADDILAKLKDRFGGAEAIVPLPDLRIERL